MTDPVRAAGGVLYRPAGDGPEVALVHRPRYDDWSLPKGKLDNGEHPLAGAVREVHEETGVPGRPELRLPTVAYELPDSTPKTVDYWLMRAGAEGEVQDTDEVDRLEWLPLPAAAERLSYDDERDLLGHVAALPPITAVAALVRHGHAGERKKWAGKDALRPLDPVGQAEAERLAELLVLLQPKRLITAGPLRCKQTLEPLAAALDDMPIVIDSAFAEPPDAEDAPAKARLAAQRMRELVDMRDGGVPVICSQGKLLPTLLATLAGGTDKEPFKTPKGGGWLLTWSGERLLDPSRL
jgi:8-oxo-dGTP pyrophosphatase MutT (NUDIX family)/phosphohistidine phosphatase SixA